MSRSAVLLRLPGDLHVELKRRAAESEVSLNSLCFELIKDGLKNKPASEESFAEIVKKLQAAKGKDLEGIILFGSEARGEARDNSDIDLLVVLAENVPISRGLYREWEEHCGGLSAIQKEINPHFVHLPASADKVGGIWLECALEGIIIYDLAGRIRQVLREIRKRIAEGAFRRSAAYGHPYWTRQSPNREKNGK